MAPMEADPAYEQLRVFTERISKLDAVQWGQMRDSFHPVQVSKGQHWLQGGDVCSHIAFVVKGLMHSYYIADGEVVTEEFYFENAYTTNYTSFLTRQPSRRYLQALEDCELLVFSYEDLQRFYSTSKAAERMGRLIAEAIYLRFDHRTHQFLVKSPEERYLDLVKDRPQLMQRAPQKLIASYLGITAESLSRIRKRVVKG
jgi:CRP-like cAMP-binding protein